MSEEETERDEDLEDERKKLNELGVKSTWNILTSGEKKKKESKEKSKFPKFK